MMRVIETDSSGARYHRASSEPRVRRSRAGRPDLGVRALPARIPRIGPEYRVERRQLSSGNIVRPGGGPGGAGGYETGESAE